MLRGLYTSWTGMVNEQNRLDVISNNLANSDTAGYKQESVSSQAFDKLLTIKIGTIAPCQTMNLSAADLQIHFIKRLYSPKSFAYLADL